MASVSPWLQGTDGLGSCRYVKIYPSEAQSALVSSVRLKAYVTPMVTYAVMPSLPFAYYVDVRSKEIAIRMSDE